ncbi:tetratricopeptide repeat-containing hybrid sensor histidine kinase/response regulator [Neptunitalea lumnitzerae]|uniref:histidine kinase n=1 Tax=Neptunitalea lumnitzerae TaxID=2965509 RepID=A0ABQ5MJT8_9FLAO|nr:ATP-binding protein [Neptunitalea sp. Y10]GLB49678.1 histidine kinase [Neptunitalea sp. Y10]
MKNFYLFLCLLLCAFGSSFAEPYSKDSLNIILQQGYDYMDKKDYIESVKSGRLLLEQAYKEGDSVFIAEAYYLLALNDEYIEEYSRAKDKYLKTLDIAEKIKDSLFIIDIYNGLGNIASLHDKDHKKSKEFYLQALDICEKMRVKNRMTYVINLCWEYLDLKEYDSITTYLPSFDVYFQENELKSNIDIDGTKCHSYYVLGRYYGEKGEVEKGLNYLDKALTYVDKYQLDDEAADVYEEQVKLYKQIGDKQKAFEALQNYVATYKKINDLSMLKKMQIEEVKYKVEEYQRTIEIAEKEKQLADAEAASSAKLNRVYMVVSFLLLILLGFILRENIVKKRLITDLNENNKQLIEAKKQASLAAEAKSNFVSNISHELRTPLHGVTGITSLLLAEKEISSKNRQLLESLKFSGDYLLGLINNVLLLSKIDNNKVKVLPKEFNIHNFFDNIKHSIEYSATKHNVAVSFVVGEEIPKIIVLDESILSEVLINLMENAIKFSKNGRVVVEVKKGPELRLEDKKMRIRFAVKDDGKGIPEDQKKQIFQKFSQISENQSIMEGAGLGLSIVKSLLEQMGSSIHLKSKEGLGTIFYFDLVAGIVEDEKCRKANSEEAYKSKFVDKKILLVEDNEINKLVLNKFLSIYNVNLDVYSNGNEGLEAIKASDYDLALLDINVPGLNGYEITRSVREFDKELPIVAVTASELSEIEDIAMEAGMDDILIKPFNKNKLLEILIKYLA